MPPLKLAFVLDNEVVDILHTDERLAAIMLSQPLVVDVTELYDATPIPVGFFYNPVDGTFSATPAE